MLHHMALLADHANGRNRRERVFRDHNDLLVGYIKICNSMSDHFFFVAAFSVSVFIQDACLYFVIVLLIISSSSAYPGSGRGGGSSSRGPQTSPSRATLTSSDGGIPRRSQASVEI